MLFLFYNNSEEDVKMEEKIIEVLKKANKALSVIEINDLLGYTEIEELNILNQKLQVLSNNYAIYHSSKDKYLLFENSHLKKGILNVNKKGNGFVIIDGEEPDVFISFRNLNGALNGDNVIAEIIKEDEGRILKIVKRGNETLVGKVVIKKSKVYVYPDVLKIDIMILLKVT